MWLWIILAVIILIIIYVFILYNSFISLDNKVKEAFSTMDVYLKKRWDLIPNLVETVKGYAKYEEETLTRVTKLRNNVYNEMTNDEKIINNEELSSDVSKIMALKESYPELKANTNFLDLQSNLKETEDKIQYSRQFYNDSVLNYNNKIEMFPSNIVASIFGFKTMTFFEVDEESRKNPNVKF